MTPDAIPRKHYNRGRIADVSFQLLPSPEFMQRSCPRHFALALLITIGGTACQESEGGATTTPVTPTAEGTFQIMALGRETGSFSPGRAFLLDANTGASRPVSGLGLAGVHEVRAMAIHPVTGAHYAISSASGHLVELDVNQETVRLIGSTRWGTSAMTFDGAGRMLAIRGSGLWEVDTESAELTFVSALTTPVEFADPPLDQPLSLAGLAFNESDGELYGVETLHKKLYRIDPVTGASTPVGSGHGRQLRSLAYVSGSQSLYSIDVGSRELVTLDSTNGSSLLVGRLPGYGSWESLCYDVSSESLYASDTSSELLYSIDMVSAGATAVLPLGVGPFGMAYNSLAETLTASTGRAGIVHVDPTIGVAMGVGEIASDLGFPTCIAFDPSLGIYYGVEGTSFYSYDEHGGNKIWIGDFPPFSSMKALAMDPGSGEVYGITSATGQLARISTLDASTVILAGPIGFGFLRGLAFDPVESGLLYTYTADFDRLVSIDAQTGVGTGIGRVGMSGGLQAMAFDGASGELYGCTGPDLAALTRIDTTTGAGTSIGMLGLEDPGPLAYDSLNDEYYTVVFSQLDGAKFLRVDSMSGAATFVGSLHGSSVNALEYDPRTDTIYGSTFNSGVVAIDRTTAETVVVSTPSLDILELAYDPAGEVMYCIGADGLYQLVPETGATQFVAPLSGDSSSTSTLTFNSVTGMLMGTSEKTGDVDEGGLFFSSRDLISIDPATGVTTSVGTTASNISGIAFKP